MATCKNGHEFQFPAYMKGWTVDVVDTITGLGKEGKDIKVIGEQGWIPVCPTCGERV